MIARLAWTAALAACANCASPPSPRSPPVDLAFIEGCWISEDRTAIERWSRFEASDAGYTWTGHGQRMRNGQVVFSEQLRIVADDHSVTYWALPRGAEGWTGFTLTKRAVGDRDLTFENPEHDAPKLIRYAGDGEELLAWTANGGEQTLVFRGRRDGCD